MARLSLLSWLSIILFFFLHSSVLASGPTPIYINQVPEYSSLATCAEEQLKTIVRWMVSGCGDGSKTTSYACFCSSSSSFYNNMISVKVKSDCTSQQDQVTSAMGVFSNYCTLGNDILLTGSDPTATPASNSNTFAPVVTNPTSRSSSPSSSNTQNIGSSPTSSSANSTSTSTPTPEDPGSGSSKTTAIAAGVAVPIIVIAFGGALFYVFFVLRKKRTQRGRVELTDEGRTELHSNHLVEMDTDKSAPRYELGQDRSAIKPYPSAPYELGGRPHFNGPPAELESPTPSIGRR